ncbi:MAG: hypothetical protein M1608_15510, partial [Candidatus Omnitrophica bacterium]|nr:hypothetical protein [Candidatus Omnitrophota bacterium]
MINKTISFLICAMVAAPVFAGTASGNETASPQPSAITPADSDSGSKPSVSFDSATGQVRLVNGRLELLVETRPGLNPRSLRDLRTGQAYADGDYAWPGGSFPKLVRSPELMPAAGGGQMVKFTGRLGPVEVTQTFIAPGEQPNAIIERIRLRNPGEEPLSTADFKCGLTKRLEAGDQWLPDATRIHFCRVPYRRGTDGRVGDYPLREIMERKDAYTGWNEPVVRTSTWGDEGWVWSSDITSFLIAKYNPDAMEWSLMEPVQRELTAESNSTPRPEKVLRFAGAGQWKQGVPEGASRLSPGQAFSFGDTWLQVVDGDWKEAYYAYRRFTESRGCRLHPGYN